MADIIPFKGILYNKSKIVDIKKVLAPPYDAIPKDSLNNYYKASHYNISHLILPKDYKTSGRLFRKWMKRGVLIQDKRDSIYLYEQGYILNGKPFKRLGFIALLKIEEYSTNRIFPHETTFDGPKHDRMLLLKEVKANLCPVFFVFSHRMHDVLGVLLKEYTKNHRPYIKVCMDKEIDRLWRIWQPSLLRTIISQIKERRLFIADGHHRYEVAIALSKSYPYVMAYFCDSASDGLMILPTHRLVKTKDPSCIERFFNVIEVGSKEKMFYSMKRQKRWIFGMYTGGKFYILKLKDSLTPELQNSKTLDVSILHSTVLKELKDIAYTSDATEAVRLVDTGVYATAFFLNPTKMKDVMDYALSGLRMPQKSTYFYPKLISGLVMNRLDMV